MSTAGTVASGRVVDVGTGGGSAGLFVPPPATRYFPGDEIVLDDDEYARLVRR